MTSYPIQGIFHCITCWFWKPSSFPLTPFLSGLMLHCILFDGIWKWTLQIFSSHHYSRWYQTICWVPELLIKHWKTKSCLETTNRLGATNPHISWTWRDDCCLLCKRMNFKTLWLSSWTQILLVIHLHCKQNDVEMVGWYFVDSTFAETDQTCKLIEVWN